MPAPAPTPDRPDAALIAYEAELEALVVEWETLDDAWPKGRTAMALLALGAEGDGALIIAGTE